MEQSSQNNKQCSVVASNGESNMSDIENNSDTNVEYENQEYNVSTHNWCY